MTTTEPTRPLTTGTPSEAAAALDQALTATRAADADVVHAALTLLCVQVRTSHSAAHTIVFDWSDQGDWLIVDEVLDAAGDSLDWEDEDCVASNLFEHAEAVWGPHMAPLASGAIRRPTDRFSFPIAAALHRPPLPCRRSTVMTSNRPPARPAAPVLEPGRLYLAHDRIVCADCAGMTALYSGVTIGGAPLTPVTAADVAEWETYDLGPMGCEGAHLQATLTPAGAIKVTTVADQV